MKLTETHVANWSKFISSRIDEETGASLTEEEISQLSDSLQDRTNNGLFTKMLLEKFKREKELKKTVSGEDSYSTAGR